MEKQEVRNDILAKLDSITVYNASNTMSQHPNFGPAKMDAYNRLNTLLPKEKPQPEQRARLYALFFAHAGAELFSLKDTNMKTGEMLAAVIDRMDEFRSDEAKWFNQEQRLKDIDMAASVGLTDKGAMFDIITIYVEQRRLIVNATVEPAAKEEAAAKYRDYESAGNMIKEIFREVPRKFELLKPMRVTPSGTKPAAPIPLRAT